MKGLIMKLLYVICFTLFTSLCFATDANLEVDKEDAKPQAMDPLEIVLVCPEHSVHKGDIVPKWATTIDSIAYFCNDTQEPEIAE